MKKRLLSMLLLAVMLVTAVPLGALTVFATDGAEEPSFDEKDYNALYVQDGLFFAADFFEAKEGAALSDYIWKKTGSPTLSTGKTPVIADGKLSLDADVLTVKPAGSMTASDLDITVEYVMDAKQFATTSLGNEHFTVRGASLYNGTITNATESAGMSFSFKQLRSGKSGAAWSFGNGWYEGGYASFTRMLMEWSEAKTLSLRSGADTLSFVMSLTGHSALTQEAMTALKEEVAAEERLPALAIYTGAMETPLIHAVNEIPIYWKNTSDCLLGYRIYASTNAAGTSYGNHHRWVDENFQQYFDGMATADKQTAINAITPDDVYYGDNNSLTDEEKTGKYLLYTTQAAANAAIAAHTAAHPEDTYTYAVERFYAASQDKTPSGIDPAQVWAAGWTDTIGKGNAFTGDVYAIRYYDRALTPDEMAQNRFADLAKYYKVDLTGFAGIDATLLPDVYDAVANVQIGDAGAAEAVRQAIVDGVEATYALLKVDGQASRNAFIDVAAGLMADLDLVATVVSSLRPMEPVYEAIAAIHADTAYTSAADLEADVRELYAAQYFYDSYKGDSADLNAFLAYAKAEALSIEELMSIPYDDRVAFATANKGENGDFAGVTQDTVDAYAAEVLARYADFLPEEYAYDTLYVQDGLVGQIDFFKLNPYWADLWSDEAPAPAMPTHPAATEEFDSVTERLDMTKGYILVAYGDEPARDVNPPAATEDDPFRAAERYVYTYSGNNESFSTAWIHNRDLAKAKTYDTKEEALAALEALKTSNPELFPERATHPYHSWPNPDENGTQAVSYGVYYAPVLNSDYKKAVSKYEAAVEKLLNTFLVAGATTFDVKLPEISGISSHDHDGSAQRVAYELGAGYIQQNYFSGQSYLSINNVPMTGALTGEVVMTAGERAPDRDHGNFFTFSDAALSRLGDPDGNLVFKGFGGYNGLVGHTLATPVVLGVSLTDAVTYTALVDRSSSSIKTAAYADGSVIVPEKSVTDTTAAVVTTFGYGTSSESQIFAMRFYQKSLTTAEMAQNHFADVAKYFRLDLSVFDCLSADQKAVVYKAFADIRLTDDVSKKALQALYDEIVGKVYYDTLTLTLTKDADLNRQFLALAKLVGMDVTVLEGVDADSFEPVARDILARFDPAFAQNKAVVASYTDDVLKPYSAVTFAGYQIRVDSGAAAANTAGVRAVFDVDTALLAKLSAKGAITFGVKVFAKGADESHAELRFTYNAETGAITGENLVTGYEPEAVALYERTTVDGAPVTSFNYSVVFPNEALTEENLLAELVYKYYVTVGENTYTVTAQSARFGESVSAAEVYRHFATMDKYADDRMVAEVLAVLDVE